MKKLTSVPALIVFLIGGACSSPQAQSGPPELPPVPVSTGQATEEAVPIEIRTVGTVEAYSTVEVKSQVGGQLMSVKFDEGKNVAKGDLLFEIDSRPFREALRQAEAARAKDQAQLHVAEANVARSQAQLKNAKAEAARIAQLLQEGISTRQQEDQIRTAAEVSEQSVRGDTATIESIRAALDADQAAVEQAKLNLAYSQIHAPITGRAGNLLVHQGNLVQANGDTALVVLNQIQPIFVIFGVPERHLSEISAHHSRQKLKVNAALEKDAAPVTGTLSMIDNAVDSNTGTIRLKAAFDNKDSRLWPGQFVNVALTLETRKAIVIPSESIQVGQQGSFVYVVKADQSVEPRPVEVGQTFSGKAVIEKGLMPGEMVVTDGQSRLFPGAKISTK